jgi:hypothetical protein
MKNILMGLVLIFSIKLVLVYLVVFYFYFKVSNIYTKE